MNSGGVLAGTAITNGLGQFKTESSFPDGSYYATTSLLGEGGAGSGYIDEWFGGAICNGECVGGNKLGTPITIPGAQVTAVDFVLDSGKGISGTVTELGGGTTLPSASVTLFDSAGNEAGSVMSNGAGRYSFQGLAPGNYYLKASHPSGEYGVLLYDGIPCSGCDITSGDEVVVDDADVTGIDFALLRNADIDIEKFTNGVNADDPNGNDVPAIAAGSVVTWTYEVTNTGGVSLQNVSVVDDIEGNVTCPKATLAAGESMQCTLVGTAVALETQNTEVTGSCKGQSSQKLYRNTATVTAESTSGSVPVDDADVSHYCNAEVKGEVIFSSGFESDSS